ncbi:MAG: hypothetical protein ACFFBP_04435 [Promethearchaeota archaeon]
MNDNDNSNYEQSKKALIKALNGLKKLLLALPIFTSAIIISMIIIMFMIYGISALQLFNVLFLVPFAELAIYSIYYTTKNQIKLMCKKCGNVNKKTSKFCDNCGVKLNDQK